MSRIELAKIKALSFYADSLTKSRRTAPIPQLSCLGKACNLYQPAAVRCVNLGGQGTDVDWKCEADLPESLRFGKVEVSCEGWSGPGDPFVLKGSCGLQYRLIEVPKDLRNSNYDFPAIGDDWDVGSVLFAFIFFVVLAVILYSFFRSCAGGGAVTRRVPRGPGFGGPSFSSGGFPGRYDDDSYPPPPPYSKNPPNNESQGEGWRPGFWTGAAVGGLANHLWNRRTRDDAQQQQRQYDWERSRSAAYNPSFSWRNSRPSSHSSDDRGEGSSNLGAMRSSTGLGGSNVR